MSRSHTTPPAQHSAEASHAEPRRADVSPIPHSTPSCGGSSQPFDAAAARTGGSVLQHVPGPKAAGGAGISTAPGDAVSHAGSYARTASINPASIAEQHAANRARAAVDGFHIPDHLMFSDDGWSGLPLARPAFNDLPARVRAGEFTALYVRDADRIGRFASPSERAASELDLADAGIQITVVGER